LFQADGIHPGDPIEIPAKAGIGQFTAQDVYRTRRRCE
jgi:hypothetical protein